MPLSLLCSRLNIPGYCLMSSIKQLFQVHYNQYEEGMLEEFALIGIAYLISLLSFTRLQ